MRGEYNCPLCSSSSTWELPPRARRIRLALGAGIIPRGTTSACAENTPGTWGGDHTSGNYLRVRGEYRVTRAKQSPSMELPPRARRIRYPWRACVGRPGTTSACAENTPIAKPHQTPVWNYLRVRGEYVAPRGDSIQLTELPPRARRIPCPTQAVFSQTGTTSACAENTAPSSALTDPNWNYLRVRGEYRTLKRTHGPQLELPPRARRIHTPTA